MPKPCTVVKHRCDENPAGRAARCKALDKSPGQLQVQSALDVQRIKQHDSSGLSSVLACVKLTKLVLDFLNSDFGNELAAALKPEPHALLHTM